MKSQKDNFKSGFREDYEARNGRVESRKEYRDRLIRLALQTVAERLGNTGRSVRALDQSDLAWCQSFANRPVEFIAELMGPEWYSATWLAWRVFVKALFGQPIHAGPEAQLFQSCTERPPGPPRRYREAWVPVGRRGGKSRILALIAVHLALCYDYRGQLAPGEVGYISVLADMRDHAASIMNYVKAALKHPRIASLVAKQLVESVELTSGITIEVVTASIAAVRSRTVIAALCVAAGTEVETETGPRPIETIKPGDRVYTRNGLRMVRKAGQTSPAASVLLVTFSDGKQLTATPEHPVFVCRKGFVPIQSLAIGDEVLPWSEAASTAVLPQSTPAVSGVALAHRSCAPESGGSICHPRMGDASSSGAGSAGPVPPTAATSPTERANYCTGRFTWRSMVRSRQRLMSTTRTKIAAISRSTIWKPFHVPNILGSMAPAGFAPGVPATLDIAFAFVACGPSGNRSLGFARFAEPPSNRPECAPSIVPPDAPTVRTIQPLPHKVPVYNLEVEDTPEYFANGVLVHNCDEIAFWPIDETCANPDVEILNGLRPAMATIPNSLLLAASSRYARKGALYNNFRDYFGKDEGPLVWSAATDTMNPSIDPEFLKAEYERDPIAAAAEYGTTWRSDVLSLIEHEMIEAVTQRGIVEIPKLFNTQYQAFCDPSGGSQDAMTLAIGHAEADIGILDKLVEMRPPFATEEVVERFAEIMTEYDVYIVHGDRYAGEWPRQQFAKFGIQYEVSELRKSDIYREFVPLMTSRRVRLLDVPRLRLQIEGLERRVARGGRDSIDHAPGQHDDMANSAAGVLVMVAGDERAAVIDRFLGVTA